MGVLADLIALVNGNTEKTLDVLIQEKTIEINGKVDSKANQTSVDGIDTKIGATNNTGGTASAGSIFGKLNKLLTDWTTTRAGYLDNINTNVGSLVNGRVVKSVQKGKIVFPINSGTEAVVNININTINEQKCLVLLDGSIPITSGTVFNPYLKSLTSNILKIAVIYTGSINSNMAVSWQVIEFY